MFRYVYQPVLEGACLLFPVDYRGFHRLFFFLFISFYFFRKKKKERQQPTETQNDNMRAARVKVWAEQLDKERRANKKRKKLIILCSSMATIDSGLYLLGTSLLFLYCAVNAAVPRVPSRTENIIWCFSAPNGAANVPEGHNLSAFDRPTVAGVSAHLGNVLRISKRTTFSLFFNFGTSVRGAARRARVYRYGEETGSEPDRR